MELKKHVMKMPGCPVTWRLHHLFVKVWFQNGIEQFDIIFIRRIRQIYQGQIIGLGAALNAEKPVAR